MNDKKDRKENTQRGSVRWLIKKLELINPDAVVFIAARQKTGKLDLTEVSAISNITSEKIDDIYFCTLHCEV